MSSFIRLYSLTINSREIVFIDQTEHNYKIYLRNDMTPCESNIKYMNGGIKIYKNIIHIDKYQNLTDYMLLEEWIKNL